MPLGKLRSSSISLVFDTQELSVDSSVFIRLSTYQSLALFVQSSVSILSLVPNEHYSALILSFFYSVICMGGGSTVMGEDNQCGHCLQ